MIALMASALLGLYIFLPDFLFGRLAIPFIQLKKHQRTKIEEITAGMLAGLIPFLITYVLSNHFWFFGHWPWFLDDPESVKLDAYKIVFSGLYSDTYFRTHPEFWAALNRVKLHQFRFLFWNYIFLGLEILIVVLLTYYYGSLRRFKLYRATVGIFLLRRASHWHVLFTPFIFPHGRKPKIMLDVMTTDGHLYDGEIADYFPGPDGNPSGLLLKQFRRFRFAQFEADRKTKGEVKSGDYWTAIPGANLFIPYERVANINIRHMFSSDMLVKGVEALLNELRVVGSEVSITVSSASEDHPSSLDGLKSV